MKLPGQVPIIGPLLHRHHARKIADAVHDGDIPAVRELIQIFCTSGNTAVRDISKKALCSLKSPEAVDEFCTAVLSGEEACLLQIARDSGYEPSDSAIRALFFFITSQHTHYDKTDPEPHHPHLARGYARSDARARTRARMYAKKNNHCRILAYALMGMRPAENAAGWSSDEWDIVISGLIQDSRGDVLWPLVLSAPLPKTVDALHALKASGWCPEGDEKTAWEEIIAVLPDAWTFPSPEDLLQKTITSPDSQTFRLAFSTDGSLLCAGRCDSTISIWNTNSGNLLNTITTGSKSVRFLAFTKDNNHLLSSDDEGKLGCWNIPDGTHIWSYQAQKESPFCSGMTPYGEIVIVAGPSPTLRVLLCKNGQNMMTLEGYPSRITFLTFSSDHQTLAGGYHDGTLCIWNLQEKSFFIALKGEGEPVKSLAFSHDGNRVIVLFDHALPILLDITSGKRIQTFSGHYGNSTCYALSPGSHCFALGTANNTLLLWRFSKSTPCAVIPFYKRHITCCSARPDGSQLVSGDSNGTVRVIRIPDGSSINNFKGHSKSITAIGISPDESLVASAGWDGAVKLWSLPSGKLVRVLQRQAGPVTALDIQGDGSLIATGFKNGTVRCYHRSNGDLIRQFETYTGGIRTIALSPDGSLLACAGTDSTLRLWNVADGSLIADCEGVLTNIWCLVFMPDQKTLIGGGWDGDIGCWSVPEGRLTGSLGRHTSIITSCTVSPDGHLLATGSNDLTVRLWTLPRGTPVATLTGARGEIRALAISPDGSLLAAAGADDFIRLYNLPHGFSERIIPGHSGVITALAFTQDGQALVAGYENGTLILITIADGEIIRTIRAHTASVSGIAAVPGCEEIVTCGNDGTIRVWNLPWTKSLSQTTLADIPGVIALEKNSTDDRMRNYWGFLRLLLSLRFCNEIELCAPLQEAGTFDIQIAG